MKDGDEDSISKEADMVSDIIQFNWMAPKIYNRLCFTISSAQSLESFKALLKCKNLPF